MRYKLEHLHNGKWWAVNENLNERGVNALLLVCDEHATRYENGYTYISLSKLFDSEHFFRIRGKNDD